jgi:hypothetical protein
MSEIQKTTVPANSDVYKKRAVRFARIAELHKIQKQSPNSPEAKAQVKCLSCLWHYDCNDVASGGCEEYETQA